MRKKLIITIFITLVAVSLFADQNRQREINLANRLIRAQKYERALAMFTRLYNEGNHQFEISDGLIRCYYGLQKYNDAIKLLNQLIKENPQRYNYKIDLGRATFMNNQKEQALRIWNEVLESKPQEVMKYRFTASAMAQLHLFDEAIAVYKKAMERFKNQEIMYRDIAMLYRSQLDYKNAAVYLLKYYDHYKKRYNDIYSQILYIINDKDALLPVIAEFEKYLDDKEDSKIAELLGGLYLRNDDLQKAYLIYDKLYQKNKNVNHLLSFSHEAELKHEYQYAVKAYKQILKENIAEQTALKIQLKLAKCYYYLAEEGNKDDYISKSNQLLSALSAKDKYHSIKIKAIEFQAEIYLNYYNDIDGAINEYNKILKIEKNSAVRERIFLKLAHAYFLKNDLARSLIYYNKISSRKNMAFVLYHKGNIYFYQGSFNKAKKQYDDALSRAGVKDSITNNILEQVMLIEQFVQDSITLTKFSNAQRLEYQGKKSQAAEKYYELFLQKNELSTAAGLRSARILKEIGKFPEAIRVLHAYIEQYPNDDGSDEALFLLAQCEQEEKKYNDALVAYKRIMIDFPGSFYENKARENAREITRLLNSEE